MSLYLCGYIPESINEGEGLRCAIFVSGCRHYCKGCFSPDTWSFTAGEPLTPEWEHRIIQDIAGNPLLSGISLLGGDPFFSAAEVCGLLERIITAAGPLPIWIYSGYTYEELLQFSPNSPEYNLLQRCDVLVDGRFVEELRDPSLLYRGSTNQRLIDIQQSLKTQNIVEWIPHFSF